VYYRRLAELAGYFLRLGMTAFGGPAAHVALMHDDCVRRRGWISEARFLDVLGAANLIPGPTSTELAMHIGHARAGWLGLVVAGAAFILPAALIVGCIAALYVDAGTLPALDRAMRLVKPVVVVVVLLAVVTLARSVRRSVGTALVAAGAGALALAGMNEALIILLAGLVHAVAVFAPRATLSIVPLGDVFAYFVQAGSVVLGSGYVLLPILRGDLVENRHWITEAQLLDAIAVGQVTPGPVFTAATFIGYLLAGPSGAATATVAIFLPAFAFSAASIALLDRYRNDAVVRAFLDGVNAAAVALIAVVLLGLARVAIVDWTTAAVAVVVLTLVGWLGVNSAVVILGAAALGLLV
jgi:chromate transporter